MAADGVLVGKGYIEVEPDFSRFQEIVARKMREVLTPAGRSAGGDLAKNLARGLDSSGAFQGLRRRFSKVGDEAGKAIASKIGQGSRKAKTDMFGLADALDEVKRRSGKASGAADGLKNDMFGVGAAAKASGRDIRSVATQLDDWHIKARRGGAVSKGLINRLRGLGYEFGNLAKGIRTSSGGFSGFDGVMARVNRSAQFFRNILRTLRWPAFISGVGLAAQGLSALAAGAVAVSSALASLAGALVALPAAALAGAQAFGTLKLATAGVGDAVKAAFALQVKGGAQAIDTMRQQEDAAEQVASAERSLADTQRQVKLAQVGLTEAREDARRELEDMRLAAEGAHDTEQQGALSLQRARQELARTLADPKASRLDIREAEEAVDQARTGLEQTRLDAKRAREDYRDAQKKGVEGMSQVVSAKEAEADANRAVADAERSLTKAIRDQSDAMRDQGSAADALSEKLAALPPAAQTFARFLIGLKPRLDVLRETAAEGLFPGLTKGVKASLANFKVVRRVVDGTSSALGRLAGRAGKKLGSLAWGKDLGRLGTLNTRIIERMGGAGLHLADAFRHVLVAAEPFIDWLTEGTEQLSAWVAGETAAGRESGRLAAFFDRTRETMELLGPILKGVGGALLNIAEAARPLGNEILDSLGDAAEGWRKWTDSVKGKNSLAHYFKEVKPAVFEMGRLIRDAGKAFFELGKQRGVAELLRLVRTELIPALRDLVGGTTGWASKFLREFGALRNQGVPAFDALIQTLADHAAQAGVRIAKSLVNAFLNSGPMGRLALGGWLLSRVGGRGGVLAAGSAIGRWLGVGIASGAASAAAGGGGAAGGAAAGGIAGGILSKLKAFKWGRLGGIGLGVVLADATVKEFQRRSAERSGDLLSELGTKGERSLPMQAATWVSPLGTKQWAEEKRKAGNLIAQIEEMRRKRVLLSAATVDGLRAQARQLDLTKEARGQLERMFAVARAGRRLGVKVDLGIDPKKVRGILGDFSFLRKGIGNNLKDINRVSSRAGQLIVQTFGRGTKETRELTARNMRLTASAIGQQMERAGKFTKEGRDRMLHLLRTADLINAGRKQAQGFGREWAQGMDHTKEVTARGINAMIGEARKMPAPMRKVALETWFEQVRQARKSGDLTAGAFRQLRSRLFTEFGTIKRDSKTFNRDLAKGFVDMVNESGGAMNVLMENASSLLGVLGDKGKFQWTIKKAKRLAQDPNGASLGRQKGGFIVPGSGSGDTFKTMLPPGSFVENREAVRKMPLPFQRGGELPVALEPGERVWLPPAVKAIGARVLQQRNEAVPRFQTGGLVGRVQQLANGGLVEPKLAGQSGALRDLGQQAIRRVFEGAKGFLDSQQPQGFAGLGTAPGQLGAVEALAAKMGLQMTSGYRPGDTGSYHAVNRARDFSNGMGPTPEMMQFALAVAKRWGKRLLELIYSPLGWSIDNGVKTPPFAVADHYDHVHVAMQKGGLLKDLVQRFRDGGFVDATQTQKNVALAIGRNLLPRGLNFKGAAGIIGNAWRESLWNPASEGTGGGGLYGFTAGAISLANLKAAAERAGRPWTDIDFQNDFMWEGPEPASEHRGELNSQPSAAAAAEHFDTVWERSGVKAMSDRKNGAREAMRLMVDAGMAPSDEAEEASAKEKVLPTYGRAKTGPLNFGPMPQNLDAVKKEIEKLQKEKGIYAAEQRRAEKEGKPDTAAAIARNVGVIEDRLNGLRQLQTRLRLEKARKVLSKRISKAFGRFGDYDRIIAGSQRLYEEEAQDAEQAVALEPQPPELVQAKGESDTKFEKRREAAERAYVENFTGHVEGKERPAFTRVLERVADWRNNILRAEKFGFGDKRPSVLTSENSWEGGIRLARHRIKEIEDFTKAVAERIKTFKKKHKKGTPFPKELLDAIKKRDEMRKELPLLHNRDSQLSKAVLDARGLFFPGGENRLTELPLGKKVALPLDGSGSLEEGLKEVQGIHWPELHELLGARDLAPPRMEGRFGGVIWEVQGSIEELGLKIQQATNSITGGGGGGQEEDSELVSLLREIAERERKGNLTSSILGSTAASFEETYGNLPKFHDGGVIPGPRNREVPIMARAAEVVHTPEAEAELAEAIRNPPSAADGFENLEVQVIIHGDVVSDRPDPVELLLNHPKFGRAVRRVSGTRPTAGGSRLR